MRGAGTGMQSNTPRDVGGGELGDYPVESEGMTGHNGLLKERQFLLTHELRLEHCVSKR